MSERLTDGQRALWKEQAAYRPAPDNEINKWKRRCYCALDDLDALEKEIEAEQLSNRAFCGWNQELKTERDQLRTQLTERDTQLAAMREALEIGLDSGDDAKGSVLWSDARVTMVAALSLCGINRC